MEVLNPIAIRALNHLIQGESWAQARLIAHSGAQLRIDSGFFVLQLSIDERGLFHVGDKALQADVSISLPSDMPARFLFNRDTLFSSVKLGGSADIAESLAFVLRNLHWDAEADLAQLVGDIPARRIARLGQTLATAIQDAVGRVAENLSEYAVEEAGMLAVSSDVTAFGSAVSCLRDDVGRLEKRISRL
ncbi:MAG: hypothetical protein KKE51_02370 [Gammaproteobacteria bacterium]|nr:hypothetical protein [Gammaproteobacteria bacterium]MBU1600838.1 hypothetical protein [Gammaproteobacteria bacterium]MBU2435294.1 hypothetical protein [Gammaproteobacteria bacterium]MBU2448708.1 hypothetical protein [Gammaproteobacteria bacterium]